MLKLYYIKGKKMKNTIFKYDRKEDKTKIQVFSNAKLLDTLEMNGELSQYMKDKIMKELLR